MNSSEEFDLVVIGEEVEVMQPQAHEKSAKIAVVDNAVELGGFAYCRTCLLRL